APRVLAAFTAGGALVLAPVSAAIVAAGFGPALVHEAILAPLYGARHFAYLGRPALWPFVSQDPALRQHLFSYFPPILYDLYLPAITGSALYRDTAAIDAVLKLVYHLPWIVLVVAAAPLPPPLRQRAPRRAPPAAPPAAPPLRPLPPRPPRCVNLPPL